MSEFGFESLPALKTIEAFTAPQDRNIFSRVMEKHQRHDSGNGRLMFYLQKTFLMPSNLDLIVYASQLMQAEAMRYGVEHMRRNRGRCMGAVIWQLNDIWPGASWSSIDYYGRLKALYYAEKRFYAPVLLSCREEGLLTQNPNPIAEPYPLKKSIRLNVSNETMEEQSATVRWSLRGNASEVIIDGGARVISVPPLSSVWAPEVELQEADIYRDYVSYSCELGGEIISVGTVIFSMPKYFEFLDPRLQARREGDFLIVSARAYARGVEIRNADESLVLSDNYFDMDAGERRVRVISGDTDKLRLRSVFDIR
jgi:beta-mannosidase